VDTIKRRLSILMASLAVALLVAPAVARAEDVLVVNVPFKFMAGDKAYDAGTYKVWANEEMMTVALTPGQVILAKTRLAEPDPPTPDGRLVFDKLGDTYILSEVWVPGQDGYLMHATKEPHTHHAVKFRRQAE
jgi:hypothetical protein